VNKPRVGPTHPAYPTVDVEDVEDVRCHIRIPADAPASPGTDPRASNGSAPSRISRKRVSTWGSNVLDVRNVLTDGIRSGRGPTAAVPPAARENVLKPLAALLAAGYLRLLAQWATVLSPVPPPGKPEKPVDSVRDKSVNCVRAGPPGGPRAS
jgi:hypothetical protein